MRHVAYLLCIFVLLLPGCSLVSGSDGGQAVRELEEAQARWAARGFDRYTVDATRTCECLPPYAYTAVVKGGEVDSLIYDDLEETYGKDPRRLYASALEQAWTVEEAFDVLERWQAEAAAFRVTYHPRYGYPVDVYIDPDAQVVDEEIIRTMANLNPEGP